MKTTLSIFWLVLILCSCEKPKVPEVTWVQDPPEPPKPHGCKCEVVLDVGKFTDGRANMTGEAWCDDILIRMCLFRESDYQTKPKWSRGCDCSAPKLTDEIKAKTRIYLYKVVEDYRNNGHANK